MGQVEESAALQEYQETGMMVGTIAQMFPGMEWIPVILLLIAGGFLSGMIGIVAGLLSAHSPVAWQCGIVATAIGVGTPLLFAIIIGDGLRPIGYIMMANPAVTGVLAVALSFRPPFRD